MQKAVDRERRLESALKRIAAYIILTEDAGEEPDTEQILILVGWGLQIAGKSGLSKLELQDLKKAITH